MFGVCWLAAALQARPGCGAVRGEPLPAIPAAARIGCARVPPCPAVKSQPWTERHAWSWTPQAARRLPQKHRPLNPRPKHSGIFGLRPRMQPAGRYTSIRPSQPRPEPSLIFGLWSLVCRPHAAPAAPSFHFPDPDRAAFVTSGAARRPRQEGSCAGSGCGGAALHGRHHPAAVPDEQGRPGRRRGCPHREGHAVRCALQAGPWLPT